MLKLYDDQSISCYDKTTLNLQEAAYLNASLALEDPVPEIIPREIHCYRVQMEDLLFSDCGSLKLYSYILKRRYNDMVYDKNTEDYSYLWPLFVDSNRNYNIPVDRFLFGTAEYRSISMDEQNKILCLEDFIYRIPIKIIGANSCLVFNQEKIAFLPLFKNELDNSLYYYSSYMDDPKTALKNAIEQATYLKDNGYTIEVIQTLTR